MKILPLTGPKALRAFYAFHKLLLGLKFLPAYQKYAYEEFYESFLDRTEADRETVIREAATFVELTQEEIEAVISFATDKNGVPYTAVNSKNLGVAEIFEIIVAVSMEVGRIRIDLITPEEKKSFHHSP